MTRRNDPTPPRINPWTLIAVLGGCAAAISVALFLAMVYRNEAIDERNATSEQAASRSTAATIVVQPVHETIFQENPNITRAAPVLAHSQDPLPLPAGYRCIGKQMFHKLPNGFDQVTDGTAARYCDH